MVHHLKFNHFRDSERKIDEYLRTNMLRKVQVASAMSWWKLKLFGASYLKGALWTAARDERERIVDFLLLLEN